MFLLSSYSSLDRGSRSKHTKHKTSPELHISHTLPHRPNHPPPHHHSSTSGGDGRSVTLDNRRTRGSREYSSYNYPSSHQKTDQLSQPDHYEMRRSSDYSDVTLTPSHSSQGSYDGKGISYYNDLSPWEPGSAHSSQSDSTQSSDMPYYKSRSVRCYRQIC